MPDLSPEVLQFLLRNFDSVEAIEIVVLLQRSPDTFWTAQAVSQQLGIREAVAAPRLFSLAEKGVLVRGEQTGAYRFAPAAAGAAELTAELLRLYSEQRSSVINAIYSGSLRAFSDAFRLKNE
jgi:hypothetical protein